MAGKWKRYYGKNPSAPHELTHTGYSYNGLQTFAALYNGIDIKSGITRYPLLSGNPYYYLSRISPDYAGKKDGLLVLFIKLVKLEAEWLDTGLVGVK
jgi:hypothetical protein